MPYAIFKIENPRDIDTLVRDDMISRQSITTRDAKALGMKESHFYVKIEGTQEALEKATDIVKENEIGECLSDKDAKKIDTKLKKEEESASEGIGMIFGD
jgi:hypothetical protein